MPIFCNKNYLHCARPAGLRPPEDVGQDLARSRSRCTVLSSCYKTRGLHWDEHTLRDKKQCFRPFVINNRSYSRSNSALPICHHQRHCKSHEVAAGRSDKPMKNPLKIQKSAKHALPPEACMSQICQNVAVWNTIHNLREIHPCLRPA